VLPGPSADKRQVCPDKNVHLLQCFRPGYMSAPVTDALLCLQQVRTLLIASRLHVIYAEQGSFAIKYAVCLAVPRDFLDNYPCLILYVTPAVEFGGFKLAHQATTAGGCVYVYRTAHGRCFACWK